MKIAHTCIAHPCGEERAEGSGFCSKHLAIHEKSKFKLKDYR